MSPASYLWLSLTRGSWRRKTCCFHCPGSGHQVLPFSSPFCGMPWQRINWILTLDSSSTFLGTIGWAVLHLWTLVSPFGKWDDHLYGLFWGPAEIIKTQLYAHSFSIFIANQCVTRCSQQMRHTKSLPWDSCTYIRNILFKPHNIPGDISSWWPSSWKKKCKEPWSRVSFLHRPLDLILEPSSNEFFEILFK